MKRTIAGVWRGTDVYHLIVDLRYWGRLRKARGEWVFEATTTSHFMVPLADKMGAIMEGTYSETSTLWQFESACEIPVWGG